MLVSAEIGRWRRARVVRIGAAAVASLIVVGVCTVSAVPPGTDWKGDPLLRARTDPPGTVKAGRGEPRRWWRT
ncbi:hypothetical protein [Actinacidiphila sp. bgisy167]|uniref:hypothetical protein n=1 Tax=Actinacidiphila sp. bgisy167 TaxID=3413797 RepID=UPI003D7029C7